MKKAAKLSLIDIADYPAHEYSAMWEIFVREEESAHMSQPGKMVGGKFIPEGEPSQVPAKWSWLIRVYKRSDEFPYPRTPEVLHESSGEAADEEEARRQSQTVALEEMAKYKRQEPLRDARRLK